ncbi:uncharacterized protein [Nicotiana tomentosiformis]|uniref:uncharacterized protein n=1 Tax=Nicotiana tomentosiformis TaxID=4098 RepID=UPI00388C42D3
MFLRKFVPQSLRDAWRAKFEQLHQGTMSVSEYAVRFNYLARHPPALVATVRERVRRFIEGLKHDVQFSTARELESDISFQQVVWIACRVKGMWDQEREDRSSHERGVRRGQEREDREVRRPRRLERSTCPYFGGRVRHGRGFVGQPVQFALPVLHDVSGTHGSHGTRTAQFPQPHHQKGCFEYGDTIHMVRDCPRLQIDVSQWGIQDSNAFQLGSAVPFPSLQL